MASPASDLREWIALLEQEGELVRIAAEVDPDLEITEITDRVVKSGGPALLFERPKGSSHPLLINQFGTERRMCLAFGVEKLDDLAEKLGEILELQPPQGLVDKVRSLGKLKSIADSMPKEVSKGACQEIVLTGDDVDLDLLPIQRCWPLDPAPFITLPAVITKDQETGIRNVGMYRMQKIDRRSTFMHWQIHKDGRADLRAAPDGRIPVAVAIGLDPVTAYSASAPLPKHIGELMVAGFLKGSAVQLVKCKTVDLEVPANAEIVLEGWVDRNDVGMEGPVRRPHRLLHPAGGVPDLPHQRDDDAPRRDLPVDRGRQAARRGRVAREGDGANLPAGAPDERPRDRRLRPPDGGRVPQLRHRLDPQALPGHARKVMHAIWGLGLMSLSKSVVVVDEHVDVHDYEQVFFYLCANVDPARDIVLSEGPIDQLDHATTIQAYGGKIGIDATAKGPDEGRREWPPEIEMSAEIRARVDARWAELGLPDAPSGAGVQNGGRARTLTQLLRR